MRCSVEVKKRIVAMTGDEIEIRKEKIRELASLAAATMVPENRVLPADKSTVDALLRRANESLAEYSKDTGSTAMLDRASRCVCRACAIAHISRMTCIYNKLVFAQQKLSKVMSHVGAVEEELFFLEEKLKSLNINSIRSEILDSEEDLHNAAIINKTLFSLQGALGIVERLVARYERMRIRQAIWRMVRIALLVGSFVAGMLLAFMV